MHVGFVALAWFSARYDAMLMVGFSAGPASRYCISRYYYSRMRKDILAN